MDVVLLNKENADAVRGKHGRFSALDPVAAPNGKFILPKRCLDDPDLADIASTVVENTEEETQILPLPELGEECVAGVLYKYVDETGTIDENDSGMVQCVQTHNRTEHKPMDIPALFSFFRTNADDLDWIQNEFVEVDWLRIHDGIQYRCLQSHQTLETWTPDATPALWEVVAGPVEEPQPWVQPTGAHDAYNIGDQCTFEGHTWESTINGNIWSPTAYPAGWTQVS